VDTPSGGHDNDDYQRYESSEHAHGRLLGDFDTLLIENTDLCRWYRSPEAKLRHRGRDVNNTILHEGCTQGSSQNLVATMQAVDDMPQPLSQ